MSNLIRTRHDTFDLIISICPNLVLCNIISKLTKYTNKMCLVIDNIHIAMVAQQRCFKMCNITFKSIFRTCKNK